MITNGINTAFDSSRLRQFSIALVVFSVFWAIVVYSYGFEHLAFALSTFGVIYGLVGLCLPVAIYPLYKVLSIVTYPIGFVLSKIMFGIIFFLVITPIGFVLKIFRKDSLNTVIDTGASSYWLDNVKTVPKSQYFNQY